MLDLMTARLLIPLGLVLLAPDNFIVGIISMEMTEKTYFKLKILVLNFYLRDYWTLKPIYQDCDISV